jgi:Eukaryotic aspartyl protease
LSIIPFPWSPQAHQGSSLIRGQQDSVGQIRRMIGGDRFSCDSSHNLSFKIGGNLFPIDPRDFIIQSYPGSLDWCETNLETTDPPVSPLLHSWSLGDPFMKSSVVVLRVLYLSQPRLIIVAEHWYLFIMAALPIHPVTLRAWGSCLPYHQMLTFCLRKLLTKLDRAEVMYFVSCLIMMHAC